MESKNLVLSSLGHTWILDLDGTIVKHNGYKIDGEDSFLSGAREFLDSIPKEDLIIIVTSRTDEHKEMTLEFLEKNSIKYDTIIFNAPFGERIIINDKKPSGLNCSISVNLDRNCFDLITKIDKSL